MIINVELYNKMIETIKNLSESPTGYGLSLESRLKIKECLELIKETKS